MSAKTIQEVKMAGPLEGIRVLAATQALFGPFATMLMSDLGAEVIKVERPVVGDMARGNGPFVKGVSTYFASINRGKKSVVLDLTKEQGREIFLKLAEKSDVLVENFLPGTMRKLGLDYETVKQHNPKIIYAEGSGFGQHGPYAQKPAFDLIVQAMGGVMSITGEPDGSPVRPGVSYGDIAAALFLCIATLAALHARDVSGQGQLIDVAMLDCQVAVLENAFVRYLNTGEIPRALGTRHPVVTPFQVFATEDGYIAISIMGRKWPLFCAAIDRIDIMDDPKFETGWLRTQNYQALEPILAGAIKARTTGEWITELENAGIPCGPVNTIDQVAADPQVAARDMFIELHHPKAGDLKAVNTPFKFSETPCRVTPTIPDLGEHTEEVLGHLLGMTRADIEKLRKDGVINS
ncbi:Acetyl-CoA:oxalate CoA-transferase [subsurface metagenome]